MAAVFWWSTHCNLWTTLLSSDIIRASRCGYKGLSPDDVAAVQTFFVDSLCKVGTRLRFRRKVTATATVYFKRFFVLKRMTQVNPWLVVATVLYLASKVEESVARVDDILADLRRRHPDAAGVSAFTKELVLQCEFVVLETLHFDLVVFHPYRPLQQLVMDVGLGSEVLQTAWSVVNDAYRLDVVLLYPPHMIALAAVQLASAYMGRDVTEWFDKLNVNTEELDTIVAEVLSMYEASTSKVAPPGTTPLADVLRTLDTLVPMPAAAAAATTAAAPPPPSKPPVDDGKAAAAAHPPTVVDVADGDP